MNITLIEGKHPPELDGRWRVVVPMGVVVRRAGFDAEPSTADIQDTMEDAQGAAVYPPVPVAPRSLEDLVDYVVNDVDCEHLGVTREQAVGIIAALGGVLS